MTWSVEDWSVGIIQQYADEHWKALNERRAVLGQSTLPVPAVGANIQSGRSTAPTSTTGSFGWRYLQNWISSYCTYFVQSHDLDGTPRSTDYYDGKTAIDMWTYANLMQAVRGAAQTDFRRATSYPTDWADWSDANYSAGKITLGTPRDIFGPWIPSDIQKALNMLIWIKLFWEKGDWTIWKGASGVLPTFAEAQTEAANDYSYYTSGTGGNDLLMNGMVASKSTDDEYYVTIQTEKTKGKITNSILSLCNNDIDFYNYGSSPYQNSWFGLEPEYGTEFNSNGANILHSVHSLWSTITANNSSTVETSNYLASNDFPAWCDEPPANSGVYTARAKGWNFHPINNIYRNAVIRFDVTDGFEYF